MPKESVIRDKLISNLGIFEDGLTFVDKEHRLFNDSGAKGVIDILARDKIGKYVIIELKRSDAAARQAFFEILKYVALFRINHGIDHHNIRCFIVSTTWHELLTPFSEFRRACETQVEGFQICINSEGNVINATKITDANLMISDSFFTTHSIFLYNLLSARDNATRLIREALDTTGAIGYLVIHLDYKGDDVRVIFPFAAYVVPTRLTEKVEKNCLEVAMAEFTGNEPHPSHEGLKTASESIFLSRIFDLVCQPNNEAYSDFEVGSPDKFTVMTEGGWIASTIDRAGPYSSVVLTPDDELVSILKGMSGSNSTRFERIAKPSNKLDWANLRETAKHCLDGNLFWQSSYELILDEIEKRFPDSVALIRLYNPLNLPETLYHFSLHNDPTYAPMFVVLVLSSPEAERVGFLGSVIWDGHTIPQSVDQVFGDLCNGIHGYYMERQLGSAWVLDEKIMVRHGLHYSLSEVRFGTLSTEEVRRFSLTPDHTVSESTTKNKPPSLAEFRASAQSYFVDLVAAIDQCVLR